APPSLFKRAKPYGQCSTARNRRRLRDNWTSLGDIRASDQADESRSRSKPADVIRSGVAAVQASIVRLYQLVGLIPLAASESHARCIERTPSRIQQRRLPSMQLDWLDVLGTRTLGTLAFGEGHFLPFIQN